MGILTGISTALGVGGTLLEAFGKKGAGDDAADVYENMEQLSRIEEKYQDKKAKLQEFVHWRDVKKLIGRQRAIAGHSGTVPDVGGNLDLLLETDKQASFDAALIRWTGAIHKERAKYGAQNFSDAASDMRTAGNIGAASTILDAAGRFDWKRFTPTGGTLLGSAGPSTFGESLYAPGRP